uniref:Uncharacterized protein n=1 Tax=Trichuris muris TaxID=70415 RepID=A0A5S6QMB6_TRIMR
MSCDCLYPIFLKSNFLGKSNRASNVNFPGKTFVYIARITSKFLRLSSIFAPSAHFFFTDHQPSQCFVLIIQSDSSGPCQFYVGCSMPTKWLVCYQQAHTAEVVRVQLRYRLRLQKDRAPAKRDQIADAHRDSRSGNGREPDAGRTDRSSNRQSATAPHTHRSISPTSSPLTVNPCSEDTDPFCRLPLSALFNWPEVVHIGDLLRISVRTSTNLYGVARLYTDSREHSERNGRHGVLRRHRRYLRAIRFQRLRAL